MLPIVVIACGSATRPAPAPVPITAGDRAPADPAQRAKQFVIDGTRACYAGDLPVCVDVAAVVDGDTAGPPDHARSRALVDFACTRGHQPACVELALVMVHREGDRARGGELLRVACDQAEPQGCELFATFQLSAGPDAAASARASARRACELGNPGGCAVFGHTLLDAIGGPADAAGARAAFATACRGGDQRGCQALRQLE